MKALKYLLLCILLLCSYLSKSQQLQYVVRLTDKNNTIYKLDNPSVYLSQRCIARRQQYKINIDSSDLPVISSYIKSISSFNGITYLSESKWLNAILIKCSDTNVLQNIRQLSFVSDIMLVAGNHQTMRKSRDAVHHISGSHNNGTADYSYYGSSFKQIHIHNGEYLHDKGFRGNNMQIAVLDAGFYHYQSIRAFDSLISNKQVLGVKDFVAYNNSVNEDDNHGELCLSIMASNVPGEMIGTAPKASYWLLRTEDQLSENLVEEYNWVVAAEYADSCGADIISSSLGYNKFNNRHSNHSYLNFYNNSTLVSQGAAMAVRKGMIVCNSAGNEGSNGWKYIVFPADADSVCTVGAINTSGHIASYSSHGYPGKVKPDIVSTGASTVVYTASGAGTVNGTSFSNPNIAGLIACLWQAFPHFNNMMILEALYKSADRYNKPDNRYGYGVPDMKTAYKILIDKEKHELEEMKSF